jgi:hypothetical protein
VQASDLFPIPAPTSSTASPTCGLSLRASQLRYWGVPRSIGPVHVADHTLRPCQGLLLSLLVCRKVLVGRFEILRQDVWPGKFLQELADPAPAHCSVETFIDFFADGDR